MDKAKVYTRTGRVLLSVWVIVWISLICYSSIPFKGFGNFMFSTFTVTILNLAFNPCAFFGAVLLDWVELKNHPERKRGWVRLVIIYLIFWAGLLILYSKSRPTVDRLEGASDKYVVN